MEIVSNALCLRDVEIALAAKDAEIERLRSVLSTVYKTMTETECEYDDVQHIISSLKQALDKDNE